MSTVAKKTRYTEEEYLALERAANFKSEFHDGQIFAMAGTSFRHVLIVTNLVSSLKSGIGDRDCMPLASDLRVAVGATRTYSYPDISVVCGPPRFRDNQFDTLLNPTVIIEILSPSTEAWDRGGKFESYRQIESLEDYILIAQDRPHIERYSRQGNDWPPTSFEGLDAVLRLDSIGCDLRLREVYDKVSFDAEA